MAPPLGGAAVVVEGLTWRPYGRREPVLDHVDLGLAAGERVLLVGASGSGKSTLLRALAGLLLTADAGDLDGRVRLDDGTGPSEPQAVAGRVGLVLQDPGAGIVAASLARDVAFGLENLGIDPAAMAGPVAAALHEVRLDHLPASTAPSSLSGGEQQRLALAGALALSPRLLLLDEPLAMLDAQTAAAVRDVVVEVATRRGLTLVVVEHRLEAWLPHVDRLVVLGPGGRPLADGAPAAILAERGDDLAAAGIWVPGRPDPAPVAPPVTWAAPAVAAGHVTARADRVGVRLTSRALSGPDRVTTAVRDADLVVTAGTTTALTGPSGAGKSTLLTTLGGLTEPTTGRVEWADAMRTGSTPPHRLAPVDLARQVAWVPQRAATTLLRRTVRAEVLATSEAIGLHPAAAGARADDLLAHLGLAALADADPRTLSGGEQRRLAVAAAVLHQPALVLADEPTVGQDRQTWAAVLGVLEAVRDAGSALLVTTHDPGVVARADAVHELSPPPVDPAEQEAPTRPVLVSRCGPLALLLVGILALPLPVLLQSWRAAVAVLAVESLLGVVALTAPRVQGQPHLVRPHGRVRRLARRLLAPGVASVTVGWSTWLLGGHDVEVATTAGLRVLALVLPSAVVLAHVDPDTLGDHLARRLHLPARPVVAVSAALQRFQAFGARWSELSLARRVRGVGGGRSLVARAEVVGSTAFGLFVGVLGDAAQLALAMDARGFAGAHQRTWAGEVRWRVADTVAVALGLVPVVVGGLASLTH